MPTFAPTSQFRSDLKKLTSQQRAAFQKIVREQFVSDLRNGGQFRHTLRVKRVKSTPNVWEMSWEHDDGRATFEYGEEQRPGEPHVIWRRVGTHEIFKRP
ncbi:hypothetical protein [Amycolatopsis taiwanensis]|uniref:hypothetical protein n=1 Tax=Amycolatopsis taiwanensis TaxID=342230 RepID=UPI0004893BC4|nr:hypothetical protein [Amycolatopsis taiwanensis]